MQNLVALCGHMQGSQKFGDDNVGPFGCGASTIKPMPVS